MLTATGPTTVHQFASLGATVSVNTSVIVNFPSSFDKYYTKVQYNTK